MQPRCKYSTTYTFIYYCVYIVKKAKKFTRPYFILDPPYQQKNHFLFVKYSVICAYNPLPLSVSSNLYLYLMTDLRLTPQGMMSSARPGQTEIQRLAALKKMQKREDKISMMTSAMNRKDMMDEFRERYK